MLLGVDVGGTFTDAVLVGEDLAVHTAKVPSTPAEQSRAVLEAVRLVLERGRARAKDVERFAHGMTVATNALLQGRTARTALIATAGFTDVLELGRQARPHLYRLCDAAPAPLVPAELRFAAPERMGPDGPLQALDPDAARALVGELALARPEAVAVALLHSYADPAHERLLGALLAELLPDAHVSLSSDLVGTFREYERTATTVLDAALSPLLEAYLRRLAERRPRRRAARAADHAVLGRAHRLRARRRPRRADGSLRARRRRRRGAAAGRAGRRARRALLRHGRHLLRRLPDRRRQVAETAERTIAGRPLALPALDIHTVGAGGGSIAWRDAGGALRVGPGSAGAVPGPACYGRGGVEPTVTDANLLLGPPARGLAAGRRPVARPPRRRARRRQALAARARHGGDRLRRRHRARGRGRDARRPAPADRRARDRPARLRADAVRRRRAAARRRDGARAGHPARVLCPRASGVLCALGLAAAAPRHDVSRTVMLRGEALSAERLRELRDAADRRRRRRARRRAPRACACSTSCAISGQSFELVRRAVRLRRSRRAARGILARARAALRLSRRPRRASSSSTFACPSGAPRPRCARAPARRRARRRQRARRLRRRAARRRHPARRARPRHARGRTRRLRARRVHAARPARLVGRVDEHGTLHLQDDGRRGA